MIEEPRQITYTTSKEVREERWEDVVDTNFIIGHCGESIDKTKER